MNTEEVFCSVNVFWAIYSVKEIYYSTDFN